MPLAAFQLLDLDADRDRLPEGDVALLKDVLHHWPTALVREWLEWARDCGKWSAVVVTNDRLQQPGLDCEIGGYRGLDPKQEPLASLAGLVHHADFIHKSMLILACRNRPLNGRHHPAVQALA